MTTPYSPGPWHDANGNILQSDVKPGYCSHEIIAKMAIATGPGRPNNYVPENARLIAMAPDLLEALIEMTDMFTSSMTNEPGPDDAAARWDNARDIITKTTQTRKVTKCNPPT